MRRRVAASLCVVSFFAISLFAQSPKSRHRQHNFVPAPAPPSAEIVKGAATSSSWTPLVNTPNFLADTALLMTDGTVLVHEECSPNWHRLTPDNTGNYVNGTWSTVAPMPAGYGPLYFATGVLADGRIVAIGGEYNVADNCNNAVLTNLGAIYNPTTNTWSSLAGPGWSQIGDANSAVLPNGQFMLADIFNGSVATLDPATLTWSFPSSAGKADRNDEEGWALLPNGTLLVANIIAAPGSQTFDPSTGAWTNAASLPISVTAPSSQEIGPIVLRPDGTVIQFGANGQNAIFNTATGTWSAGPAFPTTSNGQLAVADGPAALLPSGNVLVGASAFVDSSYTYVGGTSYFEFDGTNLNPVPGPPNAPAVPTFISRMLVLPSGQVLYTGESSDIEIYTPAGSPNAAWAPTITSAPSAVSPGSTYSISGTQFNGLSQAVGYGDDTQAATNYPLVRITMTATGHVFYCRTHDHSTMGVATGSATVSTSFDVPASIEAGAAGLQVVANGIASSPFPITIAGMAVTVNTSPQGLQIVVDGTTYTAPQTFSWAAGSPHTLNVASPQSGGAGTQYVWASWSQGGTQSQSVSPTSSTSYTANFNTQYQLTTAVTPSGSGTITPSCSSGCWESSGAIVSLTARANSGFTFSSWSGGLTGNPTSVTMTAPQTVTATFVGATISVTVGSSPSGLQVIVDGTTYTAPQTFSWTAGSSHSLNVSSPQNAGAGTRYAWASWSQGGGQSQSVHPTSSTTYTANFNTQYQLTTAVTPAGSGTVSPNCPSGCWYNSGSNVSLQASPSSGFSFSSWSGGLTGNPTSVPMTAPQNVTATFVSNGNLVAITIASSPSGLTITVDGSNVTTPHTFNWSPGTAHTIATTATQNAGQSTQYVFTSWSDGGALSHSINTPSSAATFTASFTTQYQLTTQHSPHGSISVSPTCSGSGCYFAAGTVVTLTAIPDSGYSFTGWSGATTGTANPTTITMTAPASVGASFARGASRPGASK